MYAAIDLLVTLHAYQFKLSFYAIKTYPPLAKFTDTLQVKEQNA